MYNVDINLIQFLVIALNIELSKVDKFIIRINKTE